jgi:hypothetical protein
MTSSVKLAINQLEANQQAMMQQMMAYANTARNPPPANTVPITQFAILAIGNFPPGRAAHGGRWGELGKAGAQAKAAGVTPTHHLLTMQLALDEVGVDL